MILKLNVNHDVSSLSHGSILVTKQEGQTGTVTLLNGERLKVEEQLKAYITACLVVNQTSYSGSLSMGLAASASMLPLLCGSRGTLGLIRWRAEKWNSWLEDGS